jgi:phage terminase small subunit
MNNLTAKQEVFCKEIVSGKNQSEAYREAYNSGGMLDSTINSKAYLLMEKGYIRARINELREPVIKEAKLTLAAHLNNLLEIRESACRDSHWSAAVAAETARGKAAGLHTNKTAVEITDNNVTVEIVQFED